MPEQRIVSPSQVDVLDDKGDNRLTLAACHPKYSARERIIVVAQLDPAVEALPRPPPPDDEGEDPTRPTPHAFEGLHSEGAPGWPARLPGAPLPPHWLFAPFAPAPGRTRPALPDRRSPPFPTTSLPRSLPRYARRHKYSARERSFVVAQLDPACGALPRPPRAIDEGETPTATTPDAFEDIDGEGAPLWPAVLLASLCAAIWLFAWFVGRRWRKWPSFALGLPFFLVSLFFFFEEFSRSEEHTSELQSLMRISYAVFC